MDRLNTSDIIWASRIPANPFFLNFVSLPWQRIVCPLYKMLKKIWRRLPQPIRDKFFGLLFAICSQERRPASLLRPEPLYICGAFRSNSGLGRSACLYARQMEQAGHKVYRVDMTSAMRMQPDFSTSPGELTLAGLGDHMGQGTIVLHANPPQFNMALLSLPRSFTSSKQLIAYWVWESTTLPPLWQAAFEYVNAVETPSQFTYNVLSRHGTRPVAVHPHLVEQPNCIRLRNKADRVLHCLNIFDAGSSFERKNPEAILAAFSRAFLPGEADLTFKVSHPDADRARYQKFREACQRVPGARLIEDVYSWEEMERLYQAHDVYISLHRSEGFGLTIREALNMGLCVLATGWSGNMDFMNHPNAQAVPYSLANHQFSKGAYKGLTNTWAEPDVEECARMLRALRERIIGSSLSQPANQDSKRIQHILAQ